MPLKTSQQYLQSLDLLAHIMGKPTISLSGPGLVQPSRQAGAFTYDPASAELFQVESSPCAIRR